MKRLLFAFLIGISASLVSAFEIDLSYAMETPEKYKYTYEDYTSYGYIKSDVDVERVFSLFGIDLNINCPFGHPDGIFEAGMRFDGGLDTVIGYKSSDGRETEHKGMGWWFTIGPMFRLNPHEKHSFTVMPGFLFGGSKSKDTRTELTANTNSWTYSEIQVEETLSLFHLDFTINTAYKYWFVNRPGFHSGLNIGFDWNIPITGSIKSSYNTDIPNYSGSDNYNLNNNGLNLRLVLGVCFDIGDRSIDRKNGTAKYKEKVDIGSLPGFYDEETESDSDGKSEVKEAGSGASFEKTSASGENPDGAENTDSPEKKNNRVPSTYVSPVFKTLVDKRLKW